MRSFHVRPSVLSVDPRAKLIVYSSLFLREQLRGSGPLKRGDSHMVATCSSHLTELSAIMDGGCKRVVTPLNVGSVYVRNCVRRI